MITQYLGKLALTGILNPRPPRMKTIKTDIYGLHHNQDKNPKLGIFNLLTLFTILCFVYSSTAVKRESPFIFPDRNRQEHNELNPSEAQIKHFPFHV